MSSTTKGINTICTHEGSLEDTIYKGTVSPLYTAFNIAIFFTKIILRMDFISAIN